MRSRPSLVVVTLALVAGCHRSTYTPAPAPAPSTTATSATVLEAGSAAPVSAEGGHGGDAAAEELPVIVTGPRAATQLFTLGATLSFDIIDVVDTHDPDAPGPHKSAGIASATVESVMRVGERLVVAELAWTMPEDLAWFSPPHRWALRDGAVWVLSSDLGPSEATDDALDAAPPVLTARDAARTGGCKEARDTSPYGPSLQRACFDARGLVSWREVNRSGPRRLTMTRR